MRATEVTISVLCGGKSSRMGFDKALLHIDGHSVLEQTCQILQTVFPRLILVADKADKFSEHLRSAYEIVEDDVPGQGPLGGLVTAFHHTDTSYVFLIACDIPHITSELVRELAQHVHGQQVVVYSDDYIETLFAFYKRSCLPTFERLLQQGQGKIRAGFNELDVEYVTSKHPSLVNVNEPSKLREWA